MAAHVPVQIPEHLSRADIGAYMRDLRLHYGLSEQDVSQQLHLRPRYVTAIEQADYSAMPGKAYARGYVHTYAEFLGLDADQVAERCFGAEAAQPATPQPVPQGAQAVRPWQGPSLIAILLIGSIYAALQYQAPLSTEQPEVARVEEVPEEFLSGLRTLYMPRPEAMPCLEGRLLGCYHSSPVMALLAPLPVPDMAPLPVDIPVEATAEPSSQEEEE